jgi:hypothetical protein
MKKLLIIFLALGSISSFASEVDAKAAFSKDYSVRMAIELSLPEMEIGEMTSALLNGNCGVAGCGDTYLVSQALTSKGANTQTTTITAIVSRGNPLINYTVKIVDSQDIIDLGN